MSTVQIALPGRSEWKTAAVICRDPNGVYVGAIGMVGGMGGLVLVRFRQGGREIKKVARQSHIYGRYEYLDNPQLADRAAA
jgi:hypothetical protein